MPDATSRYTFTLLRAGEFRLDAGSMLGLIPRVVWSRSVPVDDRNRMTLQHNCLLLERDGPGPGPRRILIEAGTGDKLDEKSRDLFALESTSVEAAVANTGVDPASIDAAIVSHLHFDHAGGLTRLCRAGESAHWTGPASTFGAPRGDHAVRRTFERALLIVQHREWLDALDNRSVMTRTYFTDHLAPLADSVRLVDSLPPFPSGHRPGRESEPLYPQEARETEVLPGIHVFLVPGHTWGQQAVRFTTPTGQQVVFTPDVMPTVQHVGAAYSLAYDVEPYTSMVTRTWFLREAADRDWTLVLDHEPGDPIRRVVRSAKGWYDLVPAGPA
ncbi:MAG: MBL fold metallo-hydrolase [Phycisphaerales bacterium]